MCIGTIQTHLKALERKGALQRRPFQARGLCPTEESHPLGGVSVREIPIVGRVAAGRPLLAEEHIEGAIPISPEWATGEGLFFLRVTGSSMVPTLCDGDYLLVRRQAAVEDGAIAVALLEGEMTVKRVVLAGHCLTLQPDNDAFPSLRVDIRQRPVQILGKAIGVYHRLCRSTAVFVNRKGSQCGNSLGTSITEKGAS